MSANPTKTPGSYSRVMLKISGEALMGDQGYGLHPPTVARTSGGVGGITASPCVSAFR